MGSEVKIIWGLLVGINDKRYEYAEKRKVHTPILSSPSYPTLLTFLP